VQWIHLPDMPARDRTDILKCLLQNRVRKNTLLKRLFFDPVFLNPQGRTSIHQDLRVAADGIEKYGRCQHDAIGGEQQIEDSLKVVFNYAAALLFASIYFHAGGNVQIPKND
jgi:hypothetical protein